MQLIREIRNIDSDNIVIHIPKEFRKKRVEILVFSLEKKKREELAPKNLRKKDLNASGLCGLWEDERSPDEIINDIYVHRTGFGNRQVEL